MKFRSPFVSINFPLFPTFLVLSVPLYQNCYFTKNYFPIPPFVFSFTPVPFFVKRPYPFNCFSSMKSTLPVCFRKCSFKCCFFPYSRSHPGNSQRYLEIFIVFGPRLILEWTSYWSPPSPLFLRSSPSCGLCSRAPLATSKSQTWMEDIFEK